MRKTTTDYGCRGFSMVELLVVLGIVGLAAAVLLPAVQTVQRTAATTQCADNLRTLGLALTGYANDHQYYPYGQYQAGLDTLTGTPQPDRGNTVESRDSYIWWSTLRGYLSGAGTPSNNGAGADDESPFTRINAVFNCPDAIDRVNGVDYVPNAGVMVQRLLELSAITGHPLNRNRPTSLGRPTSVYSDTVLLWDAPEVISASRPGFRKNQYVISYVIDEGPGTSKASGSNNGLLASPRKPSWRYRNVMSNSRIIEPKDYADHTPIYTGVNIDVSNEFESITAGGIRFRHNANTRANFLFADGSVRSHGPTLNWNTSPTGTLLRKYFRSKLPPGHNSIDAPN